MSVHVIAEAGQCKGSYDEAHDMVEAAARAGCWAMKIQLLVPDRIASPDAALYWDERRPEITDQRTSFAEVGWLPYDVGRLLELARFAHSKDIRLGASVFDLEAVSVARDARLDFVKIASGDITNRPLIEAAAAAFPGQVMLSTGASHRAEIERAVLWADARNVACVMACPLVYPSDPDVAEIGRVAALYRLRGPLGHWEVGYSDHTCGTHAAPIAAGAGATVLEKHFTIDPWDSSVPDNAFALAPEEMGHYVTKARTAAKYLGDGHLVPTGPEEAARRGARRSICARYMVPAGHVLAPGDLDMLRPWDPAGFEPWQLPEVVGLVTTRPIPGGAAILKSDVDAPS